MDEAKLTKLKHRATQAIESARGDGFAELVLELIKEMQTGLLPLPPEPEVVANLAPTPPQRKRKVAEAGGDLPESD